MGQRRAKGEHQRVSLFLSCWWPFWFNKVQEVKPYYWITESKCLCGIFTLFCYCCQFTCLQKRIRCDSNSHTFTCTSIKIISHLWYLVWAIILIMRNLNEVLLGCTMLATQPGMYTLSCWLFLFALLYVSLILVRIFPIFFLFMYHIQGCFAIGIWRCIWTRCFHPLLAGDPILR